MPVRFFFLFPRLFLIIVKMVMVREEDVGGVEMHETDIFGPHTSSVASSLWSVHAVQDINEAHSVSSQAEGATSLLALSISSRD